MFRENQRPPKERDQTKLATMENDLQKARLAYEAFQTTLYAAHPELKTSRGEGQTLTLEQAKLLLPDDRTVLLEFVVAEDKSFLFVLTKRNDRSSAVHLEIFPLDVRQKSLSDLVTQFRQQLSPPGGPVSKAREIYDLLFKDAQMRLQGKDKLVIVPDGPLWELPFQALRSPHNRYLVQDHAISYAPSLSVLREMIKQRQRKQHSTESPSLLAVGNPALGRVGGRQSAALMGEPLGSLPDAETQVRRLRRFYDLRRSKIHLGAVATEARIKAEVGDHDILHIASHGVLNDRNPMYSHLVLAQTSTQDKEDGLLEAWEILNLDLKANLAVLSAGETARGRVGAGEGMIGLTWALFVAGVPTTVVSQWKVRADSTAELLVAFHQQLRQQSTQGRPHVTRAEALRQAALKLLGSAKYRHPFHWAGIVLVGDGF